MNTSIKESSNISADDQKQPLVQQEQVADDAEISNVTVSFKEAVVTSSKMAFFFVIGTFFHPIYSIVNNIVLGHSGNETLLAGLGLGALTIGITGLSIGICFAFGVGIGCVGVGAARSN